jgi:hypothetical protein
MKIKHTVEASAEEVNALFDISMKACLTSYSTVEEQAVAISAAKVEFEALLNNYVSQALKLGKKLGKYKADSKDDEMYSAMETPIA